MRRPRFRLGTLMILIAVAAVPPALWLNRERARKRAYRMRHAMIAAAERGDVATVRALLDQGAGRRFDHQWPVPLDTADGGGLPRS